MPETRLIIAGGRDFTDYPRLAEAAKHLLSGVRRRDMMIVTGGARGADKLGKGFADAHQLPSVVMDAEWDKYGKSAGYRRNERMAEYAKAGNNGILLAFWDGVSRGTYHMINLANKHGLRSVVVRY